MDSLVSIIVFPTGADRFSFNFLVDEFRNSLRALDFKVNADRLAFRVRLDYID